MKIAAIVLTIVFFVVGLGYAMGWIQFAASEPSAHHMKHAILFWILAFLSLIWFRFQSAPKATR